jgi:hypothetical protein
LAQQIINLGMILSSALIIWKSLILFTCSESPVVVVLRWVTGVYSQRLAAPYRLLYPHLCCVVMLCAHSFDHLLSIGGRQWKHGARISARGYFVPTQLGTILRGRRAANAYGTSTDPLIAHLSPSQDAPYQVGDIVVFKLDGRDIPIVHRVLKVHEK